MEKVREASTLLKEEILNLKERFKRMVSELNDVVWTSSLDGSHIVDFNNSLEKIFGLTPEQFKADPKLWIEMVHSDDRQIVEESIKQLFIHGKATAEYRIVKPDGAVFWFSVRKSLIYDEDGKPARIGGIAKDVTERKLTENLIITQRDLGYELYSITNLENLYKVSIDVLTVVVGMEGGGIYLFDAKEKCFDLVYCKGVSANIIDSISHYKEGSPNYILVMSGDPVFSDHPESFSSKVGERKEAKFASIVVLPLRYKEKIIGCINLASQRKILIPIYQQKGLETMASLIGNAIERILMEGEIRNMNAKLEKQVEERTEQLEAVNQNLQDQIERKTQLALELEFNHLELQAHNEQMNQTQQNLEKAQEMAKIGSWEWDLTLRRHKWSANYYSILGLKFNEVEPSFNYLRDKIHADDVHILDENHALLMKEKTAILFEVRLINADGTIKWLQNDVIPIVIDGKILKLKGVIHDITDQKNIEEELSRAKAAAEEANMAKSEFLSRMSHELRTPLNSILGFAQLMNMGELIPAHKKGIDHIMKSGKHLLKLINEVLDLSRIEAGKLTISLEPIEIRGIVLETMDIVRQLAEKMMIKLELVNSSINNLFVTADRQMLKQVLLNLINNAVKFNKLEGSVKVECEAISQTVVTESNGTSDETGYSEMGQIIRIKVIDTGIGIANEELPKLFNPFQRIGSEISKTEGSGLGLAVAKKLIEAMHGTIGVESISNQGSTFWIELPLSESQFDRQDRLEDTSRPEENIKIKIGTILYIEDNTSNIELVEQILQVHRPGIRLIPEMFGRNAEKLAVDYLPDLVLLDLNLPDIHGSEVLKQLQANQITKSIPVVVLSADALSHQIEQLSKAGARKYLTKPIDVIDFLKVIDEIIGK